MKQVWQVVWQLLQSPVKVIALPVGQTQAPDTRVALALQLVHTMLFEASRPQVAQEKWQLVQTPRVLRLVPAAHVQVLPASTAELSHAVHWLAAGPVHARQLAWQAAQLPPASRNVPWPQAHAPLGSRYAPALHAKQSFAVAPTQFRHELEQATHAPAAFV